MTKQKPFGITASQGIQHIWRLTTIEKVIHPMNIALQTKETWKRLCETKNTNKNNITNNNYLIMLIILDKLIAFYS